MILPTDIVQAVSNLRAQKTRTLLTALGIVFGVGSVIGMLAIGAGAKEESLRFIEQLGVRNILVDSRPTMSRMTSSLVYDFASPVSTCLPSRKTVMRSAMAKISSMRWEM